MYRQDRGKNLFFRLLKHYIAPYKWTFVGVLVLQLLAAFGSLYLPGLNADIIDKGVAKGDLGYVWHTGGWMLAVSIAQIALSIAATYFAARMAMSAGRDMRNDIFVKVSSFSERELSNFGAGSLITRNTNDVQQVQMLLLMGATFLISAPLMAIGGVIFAVRQAIQLSWIIAIAIPVLLAIALLIVARMVPLFRTYQQRLDGVNRVMREQLSGVRVIRAFVREQVETARFALSNADLAKVAKKVGSLFVLLFPLVMLILNVTIVAVVWFGGFAIEQGDIQIGSVFAFMQYAMQILMGILMASFVAIMIPRASVSMERINEVLEVNEALTSPAKPATEFPAPGQVAFDHVSFTYPGATEPVVNDISFTVHRSETIAIIGSTGSGKSTLINLIPRLVDVSDGAVKVGGVDVRNWELEQLWQTIAVVPQKPFLFSGTIASNLRFGRPEATDAELWQALEIAQSKDFVSERPKQLDSYIAQGGTNVSGGQRQRLAIARALVRKPEIMVFDDSFSALDVATDAKLRAALWQELPQLTKIVIAQRISTITDADRIVVLDAGRIQGIGTHEELLATNTTYQEIVESQRSAEATN